MSSWFYMKKKYVVLGIFNNSGQTAIEYLLMILAVSLLAFSLFKKMNEYLLENPNSFLRIQLEQSGVIFSENTKNNQYKTLPYTLPRP